MSDDKQESADTLEDSQSEEKTPESLDATEEASSPPQPSGNEAEWGSLSGSTQKRIKQLIEERNTAEDKAKNLQVQQAQQDYQRVTNQPTSDVSDQELRNAVERLKQEGFATIEDVQKNLESFELRQAWEKQHSELEKQFSGKDGKPQYIPEEVEDYARRHKIGSPKAAYLEMYWDELEDVGKRKQRKKQSTYSEKPTASVGGREEPMTIDSLRGQLKGPKGREIYEKLAKNPEAFDKLIEDLTQEG